LQKEVISTQNSLAVKKSAALFKIASVKSCEIKGVAKKWL